MLGMGPSALGILQIVYWQGTLAYAYNLSSPDVGARKLRVQGLTWLAGCGEA